VEQRLRPPQTEAWGNPADAAGLEQAGAGLDDDALAVGIGNGDGAPARCERAHDTRCKDTADDGEERQHQPVAQLVEETRSRLAKAC
jgi:hypothetical protein